MPLEPAGANNNAFTEARNHDELLPADALKSARICPIVGDGSHGLPALCAQAKFVACERDVFKNERRQSYEN